MEAQGVDTDQGNPFVQTKPNATANDVRHLRTLAESTTKHLTPSIKAQINTIADKVHNLIVERDTLKTQLDTVTRNIREQEVHADGKIQGLLMAVHSVAKVIRVQG